jgi:glutamate 5-kinase
MAQTDGMRMKLKAAQMVQEVGSACIITNVKKEILFEIIMKGKRAGTFFPGTSLS